MASPEEREKLQIKDSEELRKIEQQMKEQYDVENVFNNKKRYKILEENQTSKDLTLYKEPNFLVKFFNMIKGIFNKNKF